MKKFEVEVVETFRYTLAIEAVNAAAAANTAMSFEWITADDEANVVRQTMKITEINEVL